MKKSATTKLNTPSSVTGNTTTIATGTKSQTASDGVVSQVATVTVSSGHYIGKFSTTEFTEIFNVTLQADTGSNYYYSAQPYLSIENEVATYKQTQVNTYDDDGKITKCVLTLFYKASTDEVQNVIPEVDVNFTVAQTTATVKKLYSIGCVSNLVGTTSPLYVFCKGDIGAQFKMSVKDEDDNEVATTSLVRTITPETINDLDIESMDYVKQKKPGVKVCKYNIPARSSKKVWTVTPTVHTGTTAGSGLAAITFTQTPIVDISFTATTTGLSNVTMSTAVTNSNDVSTGSVIKSTGSTLFSVEDAPTGRLVFTITSTGSAITVDTTFNNGLPLFNQALSAVAADSSSFTNITGGGVNECLFEFNDFSIEQTTTHIITLKCNYKIKLSATADFAIGLTLNDFINQ